MIHDDFQFTDQSKFVQLQFIRPYATTKLLRQSLSPPKSLLTQRRSRMLGCGGVETITKERRKL